MKAVILFLLLVLIGFGFLLSENANTHRELASITASQLEVQNENQQLRDRLVANDQTIEQLSQQLAQANLEKSAIQTTLEQISRAKQQLEENAAILSTQLTGAIQENNLLSEQNTKLLQRNEQLVSETAALKVCGPQLAQQQLPLPIPVSGDAAQAKFLSVLLISGVPAIGLTYIFSRINGRKGAKLTGNSSRKILLQVTRDEMKNVIKMRRSC